jgi:exodeoxyribonuclease VII large subunit
MDTVFALSIGQLNRYIKDVLSADDILNAVWVRGEVSNFTRHISGHLYFTLKDADSQLKCVMWRQSAASVHFPLEPGVQVLAYGGVSVYERGGIYQLYVEYLQPDGRGALFAAFEKLKARLDEEGLFDEARKRPLPSMPSRVALVTSLVGAAVHDLIRILHQRHPGLEVVIVPALVQGDLAPESICSALQMAAGLPDTDVVILARGGGSLEDLWAFNDERVARAIFSCPVPVVSAVGHETDFTIADFVADIRASTPSAAAAMVAPDCAELRLRLIDLQDSLQRCIEARMDEYSSCLNALLERPVLRRPEAMIQPRREAVTLLQGRLLRSIENAVQRKNERCSTLTATLDALSPLAVLARGYAVFKRAGDGFTVSSIRHVEHDDIGKLMLRDGFLHCRVIEKEEIDWDNPQKK